MFSEFYELIGGIMEGAGGKVVKCMGDAALVVFPGDAPNQAIAGLRRLKTAGENWLAGYSSDLQIYLAFGAVGLLMVTLWASVVPVTAASATTWIDNFDNAALDGRWSWVREDATHWSLTTRPGFLRITLQPGRLNDGTNKNMLLQPAPTGDFEIQTRLIFTPTENIQRAGLVIYQDDINYFLLLRAYCGFGPPCVGNGIYFDQVEQDQFIGSNFAMTTTMTGEAYLRLRRHNTMYTAYVSPNGIDWHLVGTHTAIGGFVPSKIGLMVDDVDFGAAEIPADFDFFRLAESTNHLFVTVDGVGIDCTQANPCDLATALDQAYDGDTIYVAQGTYTGTDPAVIVVTKNITIFGGWDGSMAAPPVRDPEIYRTTLDGENNRRVVIISGDINPTLDGFTISRGNASHADTTPGYGGGIYSHFANPIISNNLITNNIAYTSTNSWGFGGGIFIFGGDGSPHATVISGNLIANNMANSAYLGKGGGLMVTYGDGVIVSNNIFQGNIAGSTINGMGGGLSLYRSSATVSGNLIQNNQSTPTEAGFGGGLHSQFGDVTLSENIILNNSGDYGAVTFEQNPRVTVTNNIIAQNPSGGIFFQGHVSSPLTGILVNNTIAQNSGEGVYAGWYNSGYSTLTLTNNIIVSHTTGIYAYPDPNPNVVIATHTLFYGNDNDIDGSTITSADEITDKPPLFVDQAGGNYHLRPNSPAIDAGISVLWLTTDIDGDARPYPLGGEYDIGVDEALWQQIYLPVVLKGYAQ